ncbi:hypothetical protein H8B06_18615 [Sphingobacterium sp. DN00404]|uniref:Uncharacterized protein n=1 Tax=Sphingobacterium micropteri TaxID=2763501 RepID=A0ABR7YU30_9SPHI|nr:hypothetical protein [Sphingobacterium micropteri]MBD1434843.1 hypothetical protein [Sphingobacterium micropteri]
MKTFKINSEEQKDKVYLSTAVVSVSRIEDDRYNNKYTEITMSNGVKIPVTESREDVVSKLLDEGIEVEFTWYDVKKFEFSIS